MAQPRSALHQFRRSRGDAIFQRFVEFAQLLLGSTAFRHFREQRLAAAHRLAALPVKFGKYRDLGAQNRGVDWLVEIVDRAGAIAFEDMLVLAVIGGEEDDRHARGLPALLDHLREFEARHAGHPHVEDHQRVLFGDQRQQRLSADSARTNR